MAGSDVAARAGRLEVVQVEGRALWKAFHRLPAELYRNDPVWIAPLRIERKMHFQPAHNPFFEHARVSVWLALRGGVPVGRITAQIDELHLQQYDDATGHFGFLEAIDDPEVFRALVGTAEGWLRQNGMRRVLGPVSFNMWDEPGVLVDGFDRSPCSMMGHHLSYYAGRIVELGYQPAQDLLAYDYPVRSALPPKLARMAERATRRQEFTLRPIRDRGEGLLEDVASIRDVMNDAWSENWGFVPLTKAEVDDVLAMFRHLLRPEALVIAECRGEMVGFGMMMPNINEAIADLDGRLLPFGLFKLLWRVKMNRIRTGRLALLGVRRRLWSSHLGGSIALAIIERAKTSGYGKVCQHAELSWILDSNTRIKTLLEAIGATVTKRYRIYEKTLS